MQKSWRANLPHKAGLLLLLVFTLGALYGVMRCSTTDDFCSLQRKGTSSFSRKFSMEPDKEVSNRVRCIEATGTEQVALMYLTRGSLFHEPTWKIWFESARSLIPIDPFKKASCNDSMTAETTKYCFLDKEASLLDQQILFNVYAHPAPSFPGFGENSIFAGREISNRVEAKWGTHTLIEAARNLFQAALKDVHNQRFVMLSESGIPIYPPTLVWQQLMSEKKSRINACQHPWMDTWRWHPAMNRGRHRVPLEGWRKSSQWMGLIREHAELFVNDKVINEIFEAYCSPSNACYSDEHYVPTLLAYLGKDQETDCWGFLVNVDWSRGGAHPRTYAVEDIDIERIRQLRIPELCHYAGALKLVKHMFVHPKQLTPSLCGEDSAWSDKLLDFHCPLFARKFPNSTAMAVRDLLADCSNKLDFTNCPE